LKPLSLVARVDCVAGLHGTETIEEIVLGKLPLPGHSTNIRQIHPPCSCKKGLFIHLGALARGVGFRYTIHLKTMEELLENIGQRTPPLYSPSASLQLTGTSQKELIHSSGALIFSTVSKKTSLNHLVCRPRRGYDYGPTGLYIFAYIKRCCLRVWLPISQKINAE